MLVFIHLMSVSCFLLFFGGSSSNASYKGQNLSWYFLISDTADCVAGGEAEGEKPLRGQYRAALCLPG